MLNAGSTMAGSSNHFAQLLLRRRRKQVPSLPRWQSLKLPACVVTIAGRTSVSLSLLAPSRLASHLRVRLNALALPLRRPLPPRLRYPLPSSSNANLLVHKIRVRNSASSPGSLLSNSSARASRTRRITRPSPRPSLPPPTASTNHATRPSPLPPHSPHSPRHSHRTSKRPSPK